MGDPDHGQAVLRLGIADRVAAGERPARLADLAAGPGQDLGHDPLGQLLGKGRDRQGEQDPAAHREHIRQGIGRGDLAECARVVDQGREEIEGADDCQLGCHEVDGRVVGRAQTGEQLRRSVLRTQLGERVGQDVGTELGRAAARRRERGQRGCIEEAQVHASMIRSRR